MPFVSRRQLALATSALLVAAVSPLLTTTQPPANAAGERAPAVAVAGTPAYDHDAPDPQILKVGSTYYAYTTGTTWGNHIGVLKSTSPNTGFATITGQQYGSSALPNVPSWQQVNTQTSPGVFFWGGRYVMYYNAVATSVGKYCLSVATSASPEGPFSDTSTGPLQCQVFIGGSIDPQPFVDKDGTGWLHWKNNDGSSSAVSEVWAAPISADGLSLTAAPRSVMAKDSQNHPWETTVDDPQMVLIDGAYYLFFTGGDWQAANYAVGYAICAGPVGPCTQPQAGPILSSYGNVAGPGGGMVFQDGGGTWWIAYAGWTSGCTNYSCGGQRKLYVATLFPPPPPPTRAVTASGYVLDGWGGLHPFGGAPAGAGGPYWPGWDIARGVSVVPRGTNGFVVDGWGGLHPFNGAKLATGGPYWPGWDIARGVAVLPGGTSGYVLDGWGGLHPFGGAPPTNGSPYWPGWDIARAVAVTVDGSGNATGGAILDAWGGIHGFGIGGRAAPGPPRLGPYWPGWDIARGVGFIADGTGGFVADGWGGVHGFDAAGYSGDTVPAPPGGTPYWPGWSIARGLAVS
jgi:hypothetical protein